MCIFSLAESKHLVMAGKGLGLKKTIVPVPLTLNPKKKGPQPLSFGLEHYKRTRFDVDNVGA